MPLIDATIAGQNSNAYLELVTAKIRYASMLHGADFLALNSDPDKQEQLLILATSRIERILEWDYDMIGHSRFDVHQALTFPRLTTYTKEGDSWYGTDIIPPFVIEAMLTQALAEIPGTRDAEPARGIKRMKADTLEIEYDGVSSQQQFPVTDSVYAILAPWLTMVPTSGGFSLSTGNVLRV